MSDKATAIQELAAASASINRMIEETKAARKLPNERARECDLIKIHNGEASSWGSNHYKAPDEVYTRFRDAAKEFAANERRLAEGERDARLSSLATQAEAIRAVLPQLAAKAAIELGTLARGWKQEAEAGDA